MLKRNTTGGVFLLGDGGSPDDADFTTARTFLPGEQVVGRLEARDSIEWLRPCRAVVLEASGEKLSVRTSHEWRSHAGARLRDMGEELEMLRDEVFGVISPA